MVRWAALMVALSLGLSAIGQQHQPSTKRGSASDLEVNILNSGGARQSRVFLSRAYLHSLPQTSVVLKADENFSELPAQGARVTGVDLDVLIHALVPSDSSAAAAAICSDGYTSPFPRQTIDTHHPLLVLTMDGLSPNSWAQKHHSYDPSPYFVTYQNFVPSFHVLAHEDHAQHPAEIIRIKILPAAKLFAAITPRNAAQLQSNSPILPGFQIAQQNCFRCHNAGDTGGTKANRTWQHLAEIAKTRPGYFSSWVQNPQSLDPKAKMPPNLNYDQATLDALTRYFQTFAP